MLLLGLEGTTVVETLPAFISVTITNTMVADQAPCCSLPATSTVGSGSLVASSWPLNHPLVPAMYFRLQAEACCQKNENFQLLVSHSPFPFLL